MEPKGNLCYFAKSLLFNWVWVQDGLMHWAGSTQSFEISKGGHCELPGCLWVHSTPEWNCRQSEVPRELVPKYKFLTCLPSVGSHSLRTLPLAFNLASSSGVEAMSFPSYAEVYFISQMLQNEAKLSLSQRSKQNTGREWRLSNVLSPCSLGIKPHQKGPAL